MKTFTQATLIAIFLAGMGMAQAQAVGDPSAWTPLSNPTPEQLTKLQSDGVNVQQDANGNYFMQNSTLHNYGEYSGVAAGSQAAASSAAAGSTAVIVAVGVGVLAVIGAVVAGSSSNGTSNTTTTSTTSTH